MLIEPTHIMGIRTTADSKAEGRLIIGNKNKRKKRRNIIKKLIKMK